MVSEHDDERRLAPFVKHRNEIMDEAVDVMDHIGIVFPLICFFFVFAVAGDDDFRVFDDFLRRIISVPFHRDRIDEIFPRRGVKRI